jgi:hypothetical protein
VNRAFIAAEGELRDGIPREVPWKPREFFWLPFPQFAKPKRLALCDGCPENRRRHGESLPSTRTGMDCRVQSKTRNRSCKTRNKLFPGSGNQIGKFQFECIGSVKYPIFRDMASLTDYDFDQAVGLQDCLSKRVLNFPGGF